MTTESNQSPELKRDARTLVVGVVVSAKMKDTITVREDRSVKHKLYGKFVRRSTKYYAHDAGNTCREGDTVEIVQTRPISKLKNWRLQRVVRRGDGGIVHTDADVTSATTGTLPGAAKEA